MKIKKSKDLVWKLSAGRKSIFVVWEYSKFTSSTQKRARFLIITHCRAKNQGGNIAPAQRLPSNDRHY